MSQSSSNNPENAENGKYRDNDAGESSRQNLVIEEEFIDFEEFKREYCDESHQEEGATNADGEVIEIEYILPPPPPFPPRAGGFPPPPFPPPCGVNPMGPPPPILRQPPFAMPPGRRRDNNASNRKSTSANRIKPAGGSAVRTPQTDSFFEKNFGDAEAFLSPTSEDAPSSSPKQSRKSIAEMRSKRADELQEIGKRKAISNKKSNILNWTGVFVRIVFSLIFIAVLSGGCFFLIRYYYEKISERGRITEEMLQKTEEENTPSYYSQLTAPESDAGLFLKKFYESLGDLNTISKSSDMLLKGKIESNGKEEEFYCLQKNGRSFVKIGLGANERAYLVGLPNEGVYLLKEGRTTGDKSALDDKQSLFLRALVMFDEPLFERMFSENGAVKSASLNDVEYDPQGSLNGIPSPSIEVREQGLKAKYFFDAKTSLIKKCELSSAEHTISVAYDKYTHIDNVQAPETRTVYLGGKPVASVTMDFMVRNRGLMFPR